VIQIEGSSVSGLIGAYAPQCSVSTSCGTPKYSKGMRDTCESAVEISDGEGDWARTRGIPQEPSKVIVIFMSYRYDVLYRS
jgi:peroxiredoxin